MALTITTVLSGCSITLNNRVYCSVDGTEMISLSKYGGIGISQDIDAKDATIFCRGALLYNMFTGSKR